MNELRGRFGGYVAARAAEGRLVVQPRMGFASPRRMRAALLATRNARATTAGTITLDSFTRVGDGAAARRALLEGEELNGYPLVAHGAETARRMLAGVVARDFPVQVRHGSAQPEEIFATLLAAGLDATEGGPVSYCLPYSRVPLRHAIDAWERCCGLLAAQRERGVVCHLESFGGCMLGQLAPPALLVALSVLEAIFFERLGLASVSLSYAQGTNAEQDEAAVAALRALAARHLTVGWHVVVYTWMGLFPRTAHGARRVLEESVRLAVRSGCERLIVKTAAEAFRIPTLAENVSALEHAARAAAAEPRAAAAAAPPTSAVYEQARFLVELVLDLHGDLGEALAVAFERGYLDVPYCLHPDNRNEARTYVDGDGRVLWAHLGRVPLPRDLVDGARPRPVAARELLAMLDYNQRRFDGELAAREHALHAA